MRIRTLLPLAIAAVGALLLVVSVFAGAGSAKASAGKTGAFKKGGTLKVALSESDFSNVDPGIAYETTPWAMLYTTQQLLVNYPEKPGAEGSKLYPEAAAAFPTVSKDGKTYVFTVRKGQAFSDGTPVTAASYKRALERNLSPKMGSPLGVNVHLDKLIQGGEAFLNGKTQVLSGVKASGQVLTVRLTKADPTFVSIMAMQWFGSVEPSMPYTEKGLEIYPSSGPYYIKSHDVGRSLVLVRNPHYGGTRPANADQIVFTANTDQSQTYLQVKNGDFDYDAGAGPPPTEFAGLGATYGVNKPGGRFFVGNLTCVSYLALNTSRAPFSTLNTRKGVEWAIDRPALLRLSGKYAGKRTDQILVPGIPGFKDFHLYAIKGADPAKAKQIAGSVSGTIVNYHSTSVAGTNRAAIIAYNLQQMGLQVKDRPVPGGSYYPTLEKKGVDFDVAQAGWCADYNDPFDFINVLLDGRTIQDDNNVNFAYYNNPGLNAQMDAAAGKFGQARANAYSKLDLSIMTKHAPWAPWSIPNQRMFVSARTKNFIYLPYFGEPAYNAMAIAG
jgi:peptide/nickel transport system substrate-binding protein